MKDIFKSHMVGDKVWNMQRQSWETIESIDRDSDYAIRTDCALYLKDGRVWEPDEVPTIYPNKFEIVIPEEAYTKPISNLEVDTKVVVWNYSNNKFNRYFAKFDNQFNNPGKILCFPKGTSSFTRDSSHGLLETWDNYEVYKETE